MNTEKLLAALHESATIESRDIQQSITDKTCTNAYAWTALIVVNMCEKMLERAIKLAAETDE